MGYDKLYNNEKYSDIYLKSDSNDTYFPAHKCVLACKSKMLSAMFSQISMNTYSEIKNGKEVYIIGDCCDKSLKLFLIPFYFDDFELIYEYEWTIDVFRNLCDLFERYYNNYEYLLQSSAQNLFTHQHVDINSLIEIILTYNLENILKNIIVTYMDYLSDNDRCIYQLSERVLSNRIIEENILRYITNTQSDDNKVRLITMLLLQPNTSKYKNFLNKININFERVTDTVLSTNLTYINWYGSAYPHLIILDKYINHNIRDIINLYPLVLPENKIGNIVNVNISNDEYILIITNEALVEDDFFAIKTPNIMYWGRITNVIYTDEHIFMKIKDLRGTLLNIIKELSVEDISNIYSSDVYNVYI